MFEMRPLWVGGVGWGGGGWDGMRLHSCEIRAQRNFKETTSHVRSQTADCYSLGDVEGRGCEWKQSSRDLIDSF